MKKLSKHFILAMIFILIQWAPFIKGVFFSGSIHTKKMPNGKTQYIILLGDEHTEGSSQQVEDLLEYIPDHSLAIVEDCDFQTVHPSKLNGLAKKMSKKNQTVDVINVEFRQYYTALLGYRVKGNTITPDGVTNITDYLRHCEKHAKESMHYNDGDTLNATYAQFRNNMQWYRKVVQRRQEKFKKSIENNSGSFNDFTFPPVDTENAIVNSISYEIDIRILHQIHAHQDKEYIFVCAGRWHTDNVEKVIFNLGYRSIADIHETYLFGKIQWGLIEPLFKPIDIKKLLLQLPAHSEKTKKDEKRFTMHSAFATSCLLPGVKYTPQPWNNSWKNYRPTAANPLANLRKYMTGNTHSQHLNPLDRLRKFLQDKKRSFAINLKQTQALPKRPLHFNAASRLRTLPRAFKLSATVLLGVGLAALYQKK